MNNALLAVHVWLLGFLLVDNPLIKIACIVFGVLTLFVDIYLFAPLERETRKLETQIATLELMASLNKVNAKHRVKK